MKRSPLAIAREYLDGSSGTAAQNACAMLGMIGGAEAAAELAQLALAHPNEALRRRAEAELARLPHTELVHVQRLLEQALIDPERQRDAYLLLGRLRARGLQLAVGPRALLQRIRLLLALGPLREREQNFGEALRAIGGGVLAGAALFGLSAWLAFGGLNGAENYGAVALSWSALTLLLGMTATRRSSALHLHGDLAAGVCAELLRAAWNALPVLPALVVVLATMQLAGNPGAVSGEEMLRDAAVCGLWLVAVRGGALFGFGLLPGPRSNYAAQVASGTCSGFALATFLLQLRQDWYAAAPYRGALWSVALPTALGLSAWYARRERGFAGPARAPRVHRIAALALLGAAALALVGGVRGALAWRAAWPQPAGPGWWAIRSNQAALELPLPAGGKLRAMIPAMTNGLENEFALELAEGNQWLSASKPPRLQSRTLDPGAHCLIATGNLSDPPAPQRCRPTMSWQWVFSALLRPISAVRLDDASGERPDAVFYLYIEAQGPGGSEPPPALASGESVFVAGGWSWIGCNGAIADCSPYGELKHVAGFAIDRTEVSAAQYERCAAAGACTAPEPSCTAGRDAAQPEHPVQCVSPAQAEQYCHWRGQRLPQAEEWERAFRGSDGRRYPWGSEPDAGRGNAERAEREPDDGFASVAPVGSFPAGASPFGALDGFGNVREITVNANGHSVLGSDWSMTTAQSDLWTRTDFAQPSLSIGFRCAQHG